ncbi:MAG: DinB family protein [Acidobacteria bacterium]|nr:DinB family protein [Acidobacteriota bacterium]
MLDLIRDLYAHQEWADAEHWKAILASDAARADADLKARLVHLHGAQQVWLGRWQGLGLGFPKAEDHASLEDTFHFARACHAALRAYLSLREEADLSEAITYTNLAGETFTQPLYELMVHLAFHSQYHRGQNATRLRALGTHAPGTDLVNWQREGHPKADWA